MKKIDGGLSSVKGFKFSAIECGIRYQNRLDFGLIYSEKPCTASGVFTSNKVFAAPVEFSKNNVDNDICAIIVNSTNANACTGTAGYDAVCRISKTLSESLAISEKFILNASTGIIGVQLPVDKMIAAVPELVKSLSDTNGSLFAKCIMTTDTVKKETSYSFETSKGKFNIAGTCKGAGMIAPDMKLPHATLLGFIVTDAPVKKNDLDRIFSTVIDRTLNAITIDGDMSTNDTAIILSQRGGDYLTGEDLELFENSLFVLLDELANMLVKDGEGATKNVKIRVVNAKTTADAKCAAKSIAESLLVKTAIFGNDPNWGRIACAAGYSKAEFDMNNLCIYFDDLLLLKNGQPADIDKGKLSEIMKSSEYVVVVDLNNGNAEFEYRTCDISYNYVKINAEYST